MSQPTLLSKKQVSTLAIIAKKAWSRLQSQGAIDESFNDWRHRTAQERIGCTLSQAHWDDFDPLFILWKTIAGETDAAFKRALSKMSNTQRTLCFRINANLEKANLSLGYAIKCARDAHYLQPDESEIEGLTPRQLTNLSYTIARAAGRKIKAA